MTPKDFCTTPWSSILQKCEAETIARNIMVILSRTGNSFRELSWDEYVAERQKDGSFTPAEKSYFDQVIDYCQSAKKAQQFSPAWSHDNS